MCQAAPGRFALGIGTSSEVIVEQWNGIPFEKPFHRVRDMIRFLRAALSGEKVTAEYDTFAVKGFRLGATIDEMPPILVAALRPGMLRLAGTEGDGAIINWLSADDVKTVVPHVGEDKEIVARVFVLPTTDRDLVRFVGRRAIAAYLNVPVYAKFHEWLGRGPQLQPMWDAWHAGDRKAATEAIPESLLDEIIVHGTPEEIRDHLARYAENGVTTPAPAILGSPDDARRHARHRTQRERHTSLARTLQAATVGRDPGWQRVVHLVAHVFEGDARGLEVRVGGAAARHPADRPEPKLGAAVRPRHELELDQQRPHPTSRREARPKPTPRRSGKRRIHHANGSDGQPVFVASAQMDPRGRGQERRRQHRQARRPAERHTRT